MLRLGTDLNAAFTRRELRVLYNGTHAYPYAAQLDAGFNRLEGAYAGGGAITGATAAIFPGLVAAKTTGENVTLAGTDSGANGEANHVSGGKTPGRAFGLFADYVGGKLGSNFPDTWTQIGVWRGVGSVYELLAPAFEDDTLETSGELGTGATEIYLNANAKGQLDAEAAGTYVVSNTARLINQLSANALIVELLV